MNDESQRGSACSAVRAARPVRHLLTVADVRTAIEEVASGVFGSFGDFGVSGDAKPGDSGRGDVDAPSARGTSESPTAAGTFGTAPIGQPHPDQSDPGRSDRFRPGAQSSSACSFTSTGLLQQWATSTADMDRLRARETAQLAAFALSRVLNREGGEQELEEFLTARTALAGSTTNSSEPGTALRVNSQYTDPRISSRARVLIAPEDAIVVAVKLKKSRLETARRTTAAAIVAFLGLHNLLTSAAEGRVPMERVTRLAFRLDDAFLPLSEVQALDRHLDDLSPEISMDQYEKQARMHIRMLDPLPQDHEAPRKKRCVRLERCDDDSAVLTMVGPIDVIEALFQRLRAMARAIRRHELGALGLSRDGLPVDADDLTGRLVEDRRIAELMFDLLAAARPQTQVRVGPRGTDKRPVTTASAPTQDSTPTALHSEGSGEFGEFGEFGEGHGASTGGTSAADSTDSNDSTRSAPLPDGSAVDVLCPTDGSWLRKQAAVTITVPLTTIMGLDDHPGRINGDVPYSAQRSREAASHSTSWYRVLTDPATSIVTDHIAQTYEPTAAMRRTIRQKWRTCTVPGCSQSAEWCEIEHCCSFSKQDPRTGGQTVMENLHPMCKHHHQLKTMGIIRLKRLSKDDVSWVLPMGVTATTTPPPITRGTETHTPDELFGRAQKLSDVPVRDEFEGPDLFSSVVEPDDDDLSQAPPF